MNDKITNKELKVWLEGEFKAFRAEVSEKINTVRADMDGGFKAVKEEIRGVDACLIERINGLNARLEMIQWGDGYFHCAADDSLVDLFHQASMGRGVFPISVKQEERSRAVRASAAAADALITK